MRQRYAFLLFSLFLLLAACTKENQPSLEGTWTKERGTATYYDARNQFVSTREVPGTYSIEITKETITYFRSDGTTDGGPYAYTREGNTIVFTNPRTHLIITTLSEHQLTLHYEGEYSQPSSGNLGGRTDTDQYFTR